MLRSHSDRLQARKLSCQCREITLIWDNKFVNRRLTGPRNIAKEQSSHGRCQNYAHTYSARCHDLQLPRPPVLPALPPQRWPLVSASSNVCLNLFLSPTFCLTTRAEFCRLIPRPVYRRGNRDLDPPHCVPLCASETMVVGRFLCFHRPPSLRWIRTW